MWWILILRPNASLLIACCRLPLRRPLRISRCSLKSTDRRSVFFFAVAVALAQFFDRYPIHRELISITKRHTGRTDPEFNLRHDWNVLLDNPDVAPMTERTKRRYPDASLLAEYIRDFAAAQEARGNIQYNTTVQQVRRLQGSRFVGTPFQSTAFGLTTQSAQRGVRSYGCGILIVASGIDSPTSPAIEGFDELATRYDLLPPTGDSFEGKRVAVLGLGNAAFETATALEDYASFVHLFYPRHNYRKSGKSWPHLSWETRYVGSLRAARVKPLDAYLLKSLDGYVSSNLAGGALLRTCYEGDEAAKCFFFKQPGFLDVDDYLQAGLLEAGKSESEDFVAFLEAHGVEYQTRPCDGTLDNSATITLDAHTQSPIKWHTECWNINDPSLSLLVVNASTIANDAVAGVIHDYRHYSVPGRKSNEAICCSPYDEVISAVGWTHDTSIYDESVRPLMQANRKFPRQTTQHESANVNGMFFAGSLSHGRDWRKGAGGFVHGFRYTAKFLARVLAMRFSQVQPAAPADSSQSLQRFRSGNTWTSAGWPLVVPTTQLHEAVTQIAATFLSRINEASAPYQVLDTSDAPHGTRPMLAR